MPDKAPLFFTTHLGMLKPASASAEQAMQEVNGRVRVTITGGKANQRRRGLYWSVLSLVTPLVNDAHNMTLDDNDMHYIMRVKLEMYDDITLPSGEVYRKLWSTSNAKMSEPDRAEYLNKCLAHWFTWTGVDATTLRNEAEN